MQLPQKTISVCLLVTLVAARVSADPANRSGSEVFKPVDTSRLRGSPDPLPPLQIETAFDKLVFTRPVALTHAGDDSGRLFVCDQPGIVWVFAERDDVEEAKIFLDLRDVALTENFEEGLLGLAFHPRYRENGELFVYYSARPRKSVVSRFHVWRDDPDRADRSSEEVILEIPQPHGNHNGGGIAFGPDGMLYIPLGDGGAANDPQGNGQNLQTLLGSILRLDIDRRDRDSPYAIPPDNPFVGNRGDRSVLGARAEIWAYGLRNPWRMAFDRLTGDLWTGDVGQDLWEEIDVIIRGGNYGWNVREGRHDFPPIAGSARPRRSASGTNSANGTGSFVDPVHEYPRQDGKSITGGLVYRGRRFPELYGTYVYADFVTFNIWGLRYDGARTTSNQVIARSRLPVSAFGEGEDGEVYFAAFEAKSNTDITSLKAGDVFRLGQGRLYRFGRRASREKSRELDTAAFPRRLSKTGLFADTARLVPTAGVIPYTLNVPLWSDGARKERLLALPEKGKVVFSETGHWKFPVGTVLVKTFFLPEGLEESGRRLETRLLVHSDRGWDGYTYLWNDAQTDARLLDAALRRTHAASEGRDVTWYFPSRSDCNACHTMVAGDVLGLNTRQLNCSTADGTGTNQLEMLDRLGVFTTGLGRPAAELDAFPTWAKSGESVDALARAYLDVNCSFCHAPGGTGLARADMRSHTRLENTFMVNQEPGQRRVGPADSRVVRPGAPHASELLLRVMHQGPGRMPPLATSRVDWNAVRVLGEWIEGLPADAVAFPSTFFLRDGERIVFLGDSITHAGVYVTYIETYLLTRFPDKRFEIIGVGLSSETASGLTETDHPFPRPDVHERLERVLAQTRPDVVIACYGMNDGIYAPQSPERFAAFRAGIERLVAQVRQSGARVVLVTPPPFDPTPIEHRGRPRLLPAGADDYGYKTPYRDYDDVLTAYAGWIMTHSAADLQVIDIHTPMKNFTTTRRNTHAGFALSSDGVHPNRVGHLLIAMGVLEGLGAPGDLASARIDAVTATALSGNVRRVQRHGTALHIEWVLPAPMPVDPQWSRGLVDSVEFRDRLNRCRLAITHAAPGTYRLLEGDTLLAELDASHLERGIDPLEYEAFSLRKRATEILELADQRRQMLGDAWRQRIGHRRPGNYPALSVQKATARAAELERTIRTLARPQTVTLRLVPVP